MESKAKELFNKFYETSDGIGIDYQSKVSLAKQCALIACEFMEKELEDYLLEIHELQNAEHKMREIQEVKTHIENL